MGPDPRGQECGLSKVTIVDGDTGEDGGIAGFPKNARAELLKCQTQTIRHGLMPCGATFPSHQVTENVWFKSLPTLDSSLIPVFPWCQFIRG